MSFDALDRRRIAWCVVISGVPYRYCSTIAPGASLTSGTLYSHAPAAVRDPVDVVNCVLDVGPIDGHIDDMQPVASQAPVVVSILARGARISSGDRIDPVETLLRVAGHAASTRSVKLLTSLDHAVAQTGPATVEVTRDVSGWPTPCAIHVGQEVMWATGTAGTGTGANPYRFTGVTRGADQWATQEHVVDAVRGEQPWVTDDVTTWRGRKAAIYVTALDGSGAAVAWVQYWAGLIDSPPTFDGRTIQLRIAPYTAVASYRLGVGSSARQASAVAGAHQFRVGIADRLNARVQVDITSMRLAIASANGVAGTITLTADSAAILDALGRQTEVEWAYDVAMGGPTNGVAASWASPALSFGAGAAIATDAEADITGGERRPMLSAFGSFVDTLPLRIVDPAGAADQIVAWPSRLQDVINTAQAWQTGPDSWADPGTNARAVHMRLRRLADGTWGLLAQLVGDTQWTGSARIGIYRWGEHIRAGWIIADDVAHVRATDQFPGRTFRNLDGVVSMVEGVSPDSDVFPHDGPAVWWYQQGEPYIGPFDADVYTGGTQQIEVAGSGDPVRLWIDGSTSGTHPETGDTVYWYSVVRPERQRNLVQMESDAPLTVQVVAAANDADPATYIHRLIASGVGNADNGAADVMPIGANLPAVAIDAASFTALPAPPPLAGQDYEAVRGKSIAEQTGGLLMACGAQLAQVYDGTTWRASVVHMGPADAARSVLTLTDADLLVANGRDPVRVEVDGRTVRGYVVKASFAGKSEEVTVSTTSERNAAGSDSGDPLTLDLPGVRLTTAGSRAQAASDVVSDIRARVGYPRVRWSLSVRADLPGVPSLGLGDVVTLTSSYAIGIDPTTTASATPCRVVGLKRDMWENRCDLEMRPFPARVGGWAQAARIVTAVGATLTIEPSDFSADDASHFKADDVVTIHSPGAWSSRASKVIASVTGATIVTTMAHGASAGDIIRVDDYASVVARQASQAFISADGALPGGVDGVVVG